MVKISVMYPNGPGVRFNHDYYRDTHMPLVRTLMGAHLKFYTIDKGLSGGGAGVAAPYAAIGHLHCESIEAFNAGFGPHTKEIMGDIPNYTDISPVILISEAVVGGRE